MISPSAMDHNSASIFSRYLACLMALLLAIQPSFAYGKKKEIPVHVPAFEGQAFEGVDHFARPSGVDDKEWNKYLLEQVESAEPSNLQKVQATGDLLPELMVAYKNFFAENLRKIDADIETLGYERWFKNKLDKNKVVYSDSELGKMEFTNIDGEPVAKIVHEKSGVAFIIYDEDRTAIDSEHMEQYLARQHYDAGSTRDHKKYIDENGKKKRIMYGRDYVAMGVRGNAISPEGIQVKPRERGVKHWWKATYKHPDRKEKILGFTSGLAQFGSVWVLAHAVSLILPGYEAGSKPIMLASFTLAYGALLGMWNSFYQNWRKRGGPAVQRLKNASISLGYYFGVYVITNIGLQQITVTDTSIDPHHAVMMAQNALAVAGEAGAEAVEVAKNAASKASELATIGAATTAHVFHNFFANNEFKNWTLWRQGIEEEERRDLHNIKAPIPAVIKDKETGKKKLGIKKVETFMPRRYWNRQYLYYLPVNWVKFIDQAWFAATIGPAVTGEYPWWTPLISIFGFWGITIGAVRHTNWMAYKNHADAAKALEIREGSYFYYPKTVIRDAKEALPRQLRRFRDLILNGKSKEDCDNLLK